MLVGFSSFVIDFVLLAVEKVPTAIFHKPLLFFECMNIFNDSVLNILYNSS